MPHLLPDQTDKKKENGKSRADLAEERHDRIAPGAIERIERKGKERFEVRVDNGIQKNRDPETKQRAGPHTSKSCRIRNSRNGHHKVHGTPKQPKNTRKRRRPNDPSEEGMKKPMQPEKDGLDIDRKSGEQKGRQV